MTTKNAREMSDAEYRAALAEIEAGRVPGAPEPKRGKLKDARTMNDTEFAAALATINATGRLPVENTEK